MLSSTGKIEFNKIPLKVQVDLDGFVLSGGEGGGACTRDSIRLGTLSKRGRRRQRREARKIFLRNPRVLLSISLLWLPCMFLFSLKFVRR